MGEPFAVSEVEPQTERVSVGVTEDDEESEGLLERVEEEVCVRVKIPLFEGFREKVEDVVEVRDTETEIDTVAL